MTISAYLNPNFTWIQKLIYLLITFAGIGICLFLTHAESVIFAGSRKRRSEDNIEKSFDSKAQRFFELVIAGTSVMSFSCAYVIINHVYTLVQTGVATNLTPIEKNLIEIWSEGKDFVLLLLICLSCVLNTILDSVIIPLKKITREEKASMRMLAMFYVILILMYLNRIGDESQYSPVMMYYFGLMIGRFVYFDASFMDFVHNIKNVFFNLPILLLLTVLTTLLCFFGFSMKFLLERNYYIVGIFYTHLFMLICIFILHLGWMIKNSVQRKKPR